MAEIVSSAVVNETVSQILSSLVQNYGDKEESNANRNLERLEMANIRLEAALEVSGKWQITDASLLRWRRKLKRAAQECDDTLHKCKQRILEDVETEKRVRNSSFPVRMAHTTKSFVFSVISFNKDESNSSIARRFEWLADGAREFLRLVELGGTPRCHMPFDPLIMHLLACKKLQHRIIRANKCPLFLQLVPYITSDHGIEARLIFIRTDGNVSEDDFFLSLMLQLSESTDIVGTAIKCLQLYGPIFKSTVETITKELMQLPTEHFSWVPVVDTHHKEHWDNLHNFGTDWFRPNPLCCKQNVQHKLYHGTELNKSRLLGAFLEPVIEVHLQCYVSLSECIQHRSLLFETKNSVQDSPYLKVGVLLTPHGHLEDILLVDRSPAIPAIYSEEQHSLHVNFTLGQLEEIMLPKAIDYFCKNDEATVYQMLWKLKHGASYIMIEKASMSSQRTSMRPWRTFQGPREGKMLLCHDQEIGRRTNVIFQFLNLWFVHAPVQLRGTIVDWIQKEKESRCIASQLHLNF
ncbi:hypothetical protein SEVIR_6G033214v4 [Setaria viridis]|uniref:Rx N-terminal domain-containing protein n=2 Tax=Setaria TaxID=4554 RepID=K3YH47_SETIT|nr:uncharacterized protein LOC101772740 [Setaria italica]XP_012702379.1 uncharacterized protein LOC101772740 [Setaria italica]XP_012702380.1 uncharacterized protein LOC101772740 [Setaria italica]XP_012702381.1 uncharacterized protein LOC101772740 [Setaria italica]XP_022683321.1 uncharacterized protein LOC101772740 [Setaria italica]XP_034600720.1 uncharacterized protein LOC117861297 [Setaria viridis]RCV29719.1 hypothetical protein SETIT_6G034900v2 [Setaria italica]RCV29720.1 hypothetical prot